MLELLLRRPEYLHILLNPVPIYGLAFGLLALFGGLVFRSLSAQRVGLVILFIAGAVAWPVYELGEKSADRIGSVVDDDGQAWMDAHEYRAKKVVPLFYLVAVLAAVALALPFKFPKAALPLALATFVLGLGTFGAGGYVAYAGGKIIHKELRTEPPPVTPARTD